MALSSGLEKRKSWVGNSCFYFAVSQSLVLERTILNLPSVHVLSTWILCEDWPFCVTVMILTRIQSSFSFWHWEQKMVNLQYLQSVSIKIIFQKNTLESDHWQNITLIKITFLFWFGFFLWVNSFWLIIFSGSWGQNFIQHFHSQKPHRKWETVGLECESFGDILRGLKCQKGL